MESVKAKVTANGQVSLPAPLRRRWSASSVLVIDKGDYAIVRPIPSDPIAALAGSYRKAGPETERIRAKERAAEGRREDERLTKKRR